MGEFSLLVRQELPLSVRPPEPQPARKPPASTAVPDNTGFAVFTAGGGEVLALSFSYSGSFSRSMEQEKERMVDEVRVKQKTKDPVTGKEEINEENYIDVKVPKEILMVNNADGTEKLYKYNEPYDKDVPDNVEILERNIREYNPKYIPEGIYAPMAPNEPPPSFGGPGTPALAANRGLIRRRRR